MIATKFGFKFENGKQAVSTAGHPHPRGGRCLVEAAQDRPDRSLLPAPRRSRRSDRRRRWDREGPDSRRQGQTLRAVRGGRSDDSSRACRPAGDGAAERVLPVVARAPARVLPTLETWASGSCRSVLSARVPHRQDRREDDVRSRRLPQRRSAIHRGEPEGESRFVEWLKTFAERRNATPAQIALAWLTQKPWIVPIPGTTKLPRLEENIGAAHVQFGSDDLRSIDEALATLTVQGARCPPQLQSLVGR